MTLCSLRLRSFFCLMMITLAFSAHSVLAATVEEIALMNRADRQKILVEGARKEGKVSLYTTLIVDQVIRPVKEAFEKEYQGKRYEVDIIDGTVSPTMVRRANLLQRFYTPMFAEYPAELKDSQGFWG